MIFQGLKSFYQDMYRCWTPIQCLKIRKFPKLGLSWSCAVQYMGLLNSSLPQRGTLQQYKLQDSFIIVSLLSYSCACAGTSFITPNMHLVAFSSSGKVQFIKVNRWALFWEWRNWHWFGKLIKPLFSYFFTTYFIQVHHDLRCFFLWHVGFTHKSLLYNPLVYKRKPQSYEWNAC